MGRYPFKQTGLVLSEVVFFALFKTEQQKRVFSWQQVGEGGFKGRYLQS